MRPCPLSRLTTTALLLGLSVCAACAARADHASADDEAEAALLAELLPAVPGAAVADVGAGKGEWVEMLAPRLLPGGRFYATEVEAGKIAELEERLDQPSLGEIDVVLGDQQDTGLPPGCCDAILLRRTYHHFTDPAAMNRSMFQALKPGGRLVIVDYTTFLSSRVEGVPENRSGHGLAPEILLEETAAAGFVLAELRREWMGESNLYCVVLERPLSRD